MYSTQAQLRALLLAAQGAWACPIADLITRVLPMSQATTSAHTWSRTCVARAVRERQVNQRQQLAGLRVCITGDRVGLPGVMYGRTSNARHTVPHREAGKATATPILANTALSQLTNTSIPWFGVALLPQQTTIRERQGRQRRRRRQLRRARWSIRNAPKVNSSGRQFRTSDGTYSSDEHNGLTPERLQA